jgi:type I restriction enzyme R subunit
MMDLPFAYSSNGDGFYEHDFLTGKEKQISLEEFPTHDQLMARYYAEINGGDGISEKEKKVVEQPYYSSQNTYPPRYYQRNAVNRTVEAIAQEKDRILHRLKRPYTRLILPKITYQKLCPMK